MPTVLLVDGDRHALELLGASLRGAGFETLIADSGGSALARLGGRLPDLVLLDLVLPDMAGTELCRLIRIETRTRNVPVVICTARGDETDRIAAFEVGADAYVSKPCSTRELALRLRAILRRAAGVGTAERRPDEGPVRIDVDAHRCWVAGAEVDLTPIEFRLLLALTARTGHVQSRERLLADVWGPDARSRTLDTHVKRLREKLGSARGMLETVRGIGYRFADAAPTALAERRSHRASTRCSTA